MNRNKQSASARVKARAYLRLLLLEQDHQCFWCRGWIIAIKDLEQKAFVKGDHKEAKWIESGRVLSAAIATVDHVIPLSKGGTSARENLVAACWQCNNDRGLISGPSRSSQKRADKRLQRKFREADPYEVEYKRRMTAARAVSPCKHPKFEEQNDAFLFCDTLQRLGVNSKWQLCVKCSRYTVTINENLSGQRRRRLRKRFEDVSASLSRQQVSAFHGLIG